MCALGKVAQTALVSLHLNDDRHRAAMYAGLYALAQRSMQFASEQAAFLGLDD
jgi:hypothetical protein